MSGMEREYIRDRTLEGHESTRLRGKGIGGASVTDDDMLDMAPAPAGPGAEPARDRRPTRHHQGRQEGAAPFPADRHANAARAPPWPPRGPRWCWRPLRAPRAPTGPRSRPRMAGLRGPHNSYRSRVLRGPLESKRPWGPSRVPGRSPVHQGRSCGRTVRRREVNGSAFDSDTRARVGRPWAQRNSSYAKPEVKGF
jgi:hypothetical protein